MQLSPRVPVAIRNDAVSRIAAVSAAATRAAGVFIVTRSRCRSPRWFAKLRTAREIIELRRNRHRQRDLGRKHREGDDQRQRQRADRERGRDGLGQSGRCNRGRAAIKTGSAGRPYHGPKSLNAQANHLPHSRILQQSRATLGQDCLENGEMAARPASWQSGYAIVLLLMHRPRRRPDRRLRRRVASPSKRIPGFARSDATRRGLRGKSRGRSRSGRRHGYSRRARCPRP